MSFSIESDVAVLLAWLEEFHPRVHDALLDEVRRIDDQLVAGARDLAGSLRKVLTGKYQQSISGSITDERSRMVAQVSSGDPHASVLEYGAHLPGHDVAPVHARALHFAQHGVFAFAARAHIPPADIKGVPVIHDAIRQIQTGSLDRMIAVINRELGATGDK